MSFSKCIFLLREDAPEGFEVLFVAVPEARQSRAWIFCRASPESPAAGFCRRLFVLAARSSELLMKATWPENRCSETGTKLLFDPESEGEHARFLVRYMRDIRASLKPERCTYGTVPEGLRRVADQTFGTGGGGGAPYSIRLKRGIVTDFFAFLNVACIPQSLLDRLTQPDTISNPVVLSDPDMTAISNPLPLGTVSKLAEQVLRAEYLSSFGKRPLTWKDRYKKALLAEYSDFHRDILNLVAIERERQYEKHAQAFPWQPQQQVEQAHSLLSLLPEEILQDRRRVVLTGDAGAGKTWTLRHLITILLYKPINLGADFIPVFVRLKDYDRSQGKNLKILIKRSITGVLAGIGQAGISAGAKKKKVAAKRNRDQELVRKWLYSSESMPPDLFLFCDGLDELSQTCQRYASKEIDELTANSNARVMLSVRSAFATGVLPQWYEFELEPLKDEQIIDYLNSWFPRRGADLFESEIKEDFRILSMARNPFFLNLMANFIQDQPDQRMPRTRSAMIEWFIAECAYRKETKEEVRKVTIEPEEISRFLREIAQRLLHKCLDHDTKCRLDFTHDFDDIPDYGHSISEHLTLAESHGIIIWTRATAKSGESFVDFSHDYFLTYFISKYLVLQKPEKLKSDLKRMMKDFTWDEAILMIFDQLNNNSLTWSLVRTISKLDVFSAFDCAARCECLTSGQRERLLVGLRHNLLNNFPVSSLSDLEVVKEMTQSRYFKATARLLATLDLDWLLSRVGNARCPFWVRLAIPQALFLALGSTVLPHLVRIFESSDVPLVTTALWVISQLRDPEGYKYLVRLLHQRNLSPGRRHMIHMSIWRSRARLQVSELLVLVSDLDEGPIRQKILFWPLRNIRRTDRSDINMLLRLLYGESKLVRDEAAKTLQQLRCKEAVNPLKRLLQESQIFQKINADILAGRQIQCRSMEDIIISLADLDCEAVEQDMTELLRRLSEQFLHAPEPLAEWPEVLLRRGSPSTRDRIVELACMGRGLVSTDCANAIAFSGAQVPEKLVKPLTKIYYDTTIPTCKCRTALLLAAIGESFDIRDILNPIQDSEVWWWDPEAQGRLQLPQSDEYCPTAYRRYMAGPEETWWLLWSEIVARRKLEDVYPIIVPPTAPIEHAHIADILPHPCQAVSWYCGQLIVGRTLLTRRNTRGIVRVFQELISNDYRSYFSEDIIQSINWEWPVSDVARFMKELSTAAFRPSPLSPELDRKLAFILWIRVLESLGRRVLVEGITI